MEGMDKGYTIDHDVKSGKLITVFSAPDYPQFQVSSILPLTIVIICHLTLSMVRVCILCYEYAVHLFYMKTSGVFTFRCLLEV